MSSAPLLFGTDGVRSIAGQHPLDKDSLCRIGAAAASVYRKHVPGRPPVFLMGRDTRGSGKWITDAFAAGAATEGVRIRDMGVTNTPSLAYLVPKRKYMGGAMVSASHNPSEFNGIKLFNPQGRKCPDAWERLIEQRVHEMSGVPRAKPRIQKDPKAIQEYLRFLKSTLPPRTSFQGLTLVVDCSHGSLSKIAPAFLRTLGAKVIAIGSAPNGRNINKGWGSQHPEKIAAEVRRKKAHAGIAFDGDADRIILCDETGAVLDGDHILACASRCLSEDRKLKGNAVVVTVMANLGLMKLLESWKIQAPATPVGDRFVSEMLEEKGYVIGGEQSGHIIFHDYLPTGDGLLTGIQILSMLRRRNHPVSWISSLFQKYPQVLKNIHVQQKKPLESCSGIQRAMEAARQTLADQGRVVVRYSGTEPLLRVMMEGPDETQLKMLVDSVIKEAVAELGAS